MLYVGLAERAADQRSFELLRQMRRENGSGMDLPTFKAVVRMQFFMLLLDPEEALAALPRMLSGTPGDVVEQAMEKLRAVLTAGDMAHDGVARRFSLLLNRFRWEDADTARREGRPYERVRSLLVISDALRVRHDGIDRGDPATVLSLLDIGWQPGEDGTGVLTLTFAGDGAVAIDAECLSVDLRDVTRPYLAVSGDLPRHE